MKSDVEEICMNEWWQKRVEVRDVSRRVWRTIRTLSFLNNSKLKQELHKSVPICACHHRWASSKTWYSTLSQTLLILPPYDSLNLLAPKFYRLNRRNDRLDELLNVTGTRDSFKIERHYRRENEWPRVRTTSITIKACLSTTSLLTRLSATREYNRLESIQRG